MKLPQETFLKKSSFEPLPSIIQDDRTTDLYGDEEYHQNDTFEYSKWRKHKLCRPSCIPISILCVMIFLVVLLPVLDQTTEKALQELNRKKSNRENGKNQVCSTCEFRLVETIPEGLIYNETLNNPSTYNTWLNLINLAEKSIEIASFYWTLQQKEVYPDNSSIYGENIFQNLLSAGIKKKIKIKIAQNAPNRKNPNIDTEYLVKKKAAEVRSLNFPQIIGAGVLHTKMWIIDRKHVYIGSANMDWRSLSQVQELGISIYNCTCIAEDVAKIFDVYWYLGGTQKIPTKWPTELNTNINIENPLNISMDSNNFYAFLTSSPIMFNPSGRTDDINGLLHVINNAEKFIYISVMNYLPLTVFTPTLKYWGVIDDALKTALIDQRVTVKMLISQWNHSRTYENNFLRSLQSISKFSRNVSLEVRRFIVPANESQAKIPYARVNHNKFMVTDNMMFIGTSNWSGDYFINTAGVSFVLQDETGNNRNTSLRRQLQDIFDRDWNSTYSHPLA